MSGWAGFSVDELRKLQQKDAAGPSAPARGRKAAPAGRSRQQLQREKALQAAADRSSVAGSLSLTPGQQLTNPPQQHELLPAGAPAGDGAETRTEPAAEEQQPPAVKELERPEVELREKTRLEQLQQEQKLMEEGNKRKKALLAKTIAEKSKQTQAEAVKLRRIQKELQALDELVSNDISILRGRIEQASWEYSAARKRYEKAEVEYITAKLELHQKTEVKEQLTEHLYAIIQQNELRKAGKLEELMEQLQLQTEEEEEEEEEERRKSTELQHHISEEERGGRSSQTETGSSEPNQSLKQTLTS
ncbi:RAB6-interacting golgin [Genypterus blacodes]|uniref:RAB6-interacting golgin n=1 Tax=Genypterus blacodes TaxID=154954 RepID=UPI003F75CB26